MRNEQDWDTLDAMVLATFREEGRIRPIIHDFLWIRQRVEPDLVDEAAVKADAALLGDLSDILERRVRHRRPRGDGERPRKLTTAAGCADPIVSQRTTPEGPRIGRWRHMNPFSGIDPAAPAFFARLAADNDKAFWHAHLDAYRATVRAPFEALLDDLSGTFGPWRTFRPQRDTRFSADKSPYKTWISGVTHGPAGTSYSLRIDRHGLRVGAGYPWMASDQLTRFRAAIDEDASGEAFLARVGEVERSGDGGPRVTGGRLAPLATAPRGYPRTHPRVAWLRVKGVEIALEVGMPAWIATADASTEILRLFQQSRPVTDWLDAYVGPTRLPPEAPRRR